MSASNKQIVTDAYQRIFGDLDASAVSLAPTQTGSSLPPQFALLSKRLGNSLLGAHRRNTLQQIGHVPRQIFQASHNAKGFQRFCHPIDDREA